jgi:hypothetical protein
MALHSPNHAFGCVPEFSTPVLDCAFNLLREVDALTRHYEVAAERQG